MGCFWLPARIPGNTHRTLSALVVALDQGGFFRRVEAEVVVDTIEPASSFAPQNRGAIKVLIFRESIFLDPVLSPQLSARQPSGYPLIKMTSKKVTYLYDLMDAAYDAQLIEETSRKFGHVPIADRNGRGKEVVPMAPHEAERYKIRSCAERANSRLKEDFGANNVMVKGHSKVTLHLMLGVVVLFADQLLRLAAG